MVVNVPAPWAEPVCVVVVWLLTVVRLDAACCGDPGIAPAALTAAWACATVACTCGSA